MSISLRAVQIISVVASAIQITTAIISWRVTLRMAKENVKFLKFLLDSALEMMAGISARAERDRWRVDRMEAVVFGRVVGDDEAPDVGHGSARE